MCNGFATIDAMHFKRIAWQKCFGGPWFDLVLAILKTKQRYRDSDVDTSGWNKALTLDDHLENAHG